MTLRRVDEVDFRAARRRVEVLTDVRAETRHRAFSIWVGLFDVAGETAGSEFVIERPARDIAKTLGVSRQAWYEYREVLVKAGLLSVGTNRGPQPQVLWLVPPECDDG